MNEPGRFPYHAAHRGPQATAPFLVSTQNQFQHKSRRHPLSELKCRRSLIAIAEVSLVRYEDFRDKSPGVSVHRLVQEVARRRVEEGGSGSGAIRRLIDRLAAIFPPKMSADTWPTAAKLMPHLLSVLRRVREDDFDNREEKNSLDRLARLAVFALLFATEDQRQEAAKHIIPDYLARVLGCFYEVKPLSGALDMLLEHHRAEWPRLQEQLLSANNYVLRVAMAEALAKACRAGTMQIEAVAGLVAPGKDLNAFELGGYALNYIYANKRKAIDPVRLRRLAEHPCYPGRSILGDMMLNLVFQRHKPRTCLTSDRFWKPIWDYVALDVHVIDAAQPFLAGQELPSDATPGAREAYANLTELDGWRRALLESLSHTGIIGRLLRDYFELGRNSERIWDAREEIAALPDLRTFMRLLFAHPIWSVAETAASVLADLVSHGDAPMSIVTGLFDSSVWRTRYGAIETSYQLRDFDHLASFTNAVHRFHGDAICKIRGLCAENTVAEILNLGGEERARRIGEFEPEIRAWLKDEDCWVLEHIYRLFSTLHRSHVDFRWLSSDGVSRLFDDKADWYALAREQFLCHIEARKLKLIQDAAILPARSLRSRKPSIALLRQA